MSPVLLTTERMQLRQFNDGDLDHLFALDNDPEVMRYINGGENAPRKVIEAELLPLFTHYQPDNPILGFWAAESLEEDRFLGWVSFRQTADEPGDISLGYRFNRAAWGQGYASEAARAIIDLGFRRHNVQRVRATAYEENKASLRVLEKLGMQIERAFRYEIADLESADTAVSSHSALWPGQDLEFALSRTDWHD